MNTEKEVVGNVVSPSTRLAAADLILLRKSVHLSRRYFQIKEGWEFVASPEVTLGKMKGGWPLGRLCDSIIVWCVVRYRRILIIYDYQR